MKKVIGINILNVVLFVLIVFLLQFFPLILVIVLGIFWLVFVIYSNYTLIFKVKDIVYELEKANKGLFKAEVSMTVNQMESIDSREELFKDLEESDRLRQVYYKCRQQFYNNVNYLIAFMRSYDYVTKPRSQKDKIGSLVRQNSEIINKLNSLVEQMISVDKSVNDVDISIVDDLISSLRRMAEDE